MSKPKQLNPDQLAADEALTRIAAESARIVHINSLVEKQIERVRTKFAAELEISKVALSAEEKALKVHLEKNDLEIFGSTAGEADLQLPGGAVYRKRGRKVVIPNSVTVELLKSLGRRFRSGIKKVETVDRDKIRKWPLIKLTSIRANASPQTSYEFELKGETAPLNPTGQPLKKGNELSGQGA